jgi:hypothetical protein
MIRSKSLLIALVSAGLGAGTLQVVHASGSGTPSVQKLDDDNYPHMRKALHDLHQARESLNDAEPIFKGHRDKAIDHVDQAIHQCEDALNGG